MVSWRKWRRMGGMRWTCCGVTRHPTWANHLTRFGERCAKVHWGTPALIRKPIFSKVSKIWEAA